MKILVLGASGMLGHTVLRELASDSDLHVTGAVRKRPGNFNFGALVLDGIDASDFGSIKAVIDQVDPNVVINCIGVIKQDPRVEDKVNTIAVNAMLPHVLERECDERGRRFIHFSTDCVFSGRRGRYTEEDTPDPVDFYGRSKLMGEAGQTGLVLRTSIIGREISSKRSLLEWFLSSQGTVRGFTEAIYSGVTTTEMARLVKSVIRNHPALSGLLHVASDPISKHDLLHVIADEYGWHGTIAPDSKVRCDRSMRADGLFALTGYRPPAWKTMIKEMRMAESALGRSTLGAGR
ncbi:dTDP-4-dehydrorhamnose reductase family protein [Mangrovihabitans endophyticus]|uniref:dTDP-4-dehydrorhamnose reductase n=1 Tax=Mangrovihabitans endophyticus TaxID=1751298 RepID=A0A8J3FPV8_9ACTN|nr:SDR family oxidoreductase [Mangrovihabitans endophyticus]GGL04424.1 NAD(P)-dependent oxidoreductase [Mangrovihabitans endophyticus]